MVLYWVQTARNSAARLVCRRRSAAAADSVRRQRAWKTFRLGAPLVPDTSLDRRGIMDRHARRLSDVMRRLAAGWRDAAQEQAAQHLARVLVQHLLA